MLREESNTFTRRASSIAIESPKITAQFFYCSALAIDDPLAAVPTPSSSSATRPSKVPPRPFSVYDNLALEQAWLKLQKTTQQPAKAGAQKQVRTEKEGIRSEASSPELYAASIPPRRPVDERQSELSPRAPATNLSEQAIAEGDGSVPDLSGKTRSAGAQVVDDNGNQPLQETVPVSVEEIDDDEAESGLMKTGRSRSFFHRKVKEDEPAEEIISSRSSPEK